jgi:hypothetical protein
MIGIIANSCIAQDTNSYSQIPDISMLTNGMAFSQFEKRLGVTRHEIPHTAEYEPQYIFDYDGMMIHVVVRTDIAPPIVIRFTAKKDNMTAKQRIKQRNDGLSRAVINTQASRTNTVPNQLGQGTLRAPAE